MLCLCMREIPLYQGGLCRAARSGNKKGWVWGGVRLLFQKQSSVPRGPLLFCGDPVTGEAHTPRSGLFTERNNH